MYNKHAVSLEAEEQEAVGRVVNEIHRRFGIRFEPGFNPVVECSNFTLQPAAKHVMYRPLAMYVAIAIAKVLSHTLLFQAGFVPYRCGSLSYWYRPCIRARSKAQDASSSSSSSGGGGSSSSASSSGSPGSSNAHAEPLPLVFFHGISPGLFTYTPLLKNLVQGRAALLVEMPHVGYGLDLAPPSREATVANLRRAMNRHGIAKACVAGHSYGTFCAAWMVQAAPDLVAQLVLLDPMCLLLALPDVTHNFLYRPSLPGPKTFMDHVAHWMASSEMGVNNTLRRHFWWFNSTLFAQDIAQVPTVVHLASHDSIAPCHHVRDYLEATFARRLKVTEYGVQNSSSEEKGASEAKSAAGAEVSSPPTSPPTSPLTARSSSSSLSSLSSSRGTSKGRSSTLELIWSEGYTHGQIIASPARQRDIAKTMWIQECRIFAEMTHASATTKQQQLSSQSSSVGGIGSSSNSSMPRNSSSSSVDEFDEAVVRCC